MLSKYLLKWNDINSPLIFSKLVDTFLIFAIYYFNLFTTFIYLFWGIFKLLYALLNFKSVVDLIYTVFSGH